VTGEDLARLITARFGPGAVSDVTDASDLAGFRAVSVSAAACDPAADGDPVAYGGAAAHAVTVTVDVPPRRWIEALTFARDELGCDFFDWLSAIDELTDGFAVVVHVYALAGRHHLLARTRIGRDGPHLATATTVYRGAAWHERETAEMFGVVFDGHPDPSPLLLPDGFEGHPLRKDFVLAARVAKPWPGGKEPGDPAGGAPARRRLRPPGVPLDWGDAAEVRGGSAQDDPGGPARSDGGSAGVEADPARNNGGSAEGHRGSATPEGSAE
jgi:NADH-quinone oxidoreductase subunit C